MAMTEAQEQMSLALGNFWPVVYPDLNKIAYAPLLVSKINQYLAPYNCQFVYPGDEISKGNFVFDTDADRIRFLLEWGGAQ